MTDTERALRLISVQYLAALMERAIWAERPGETNYCPRPELVEAWAREIAPSLASYVRVALARAEGESEKAQADVEFAIRLARHLRIIQSEDGCPAGPSCAEPDAKGEP